MRTVDSSAVRRMGYDPDTRMVGVVFAGGGMRYGYPGLADDEIVRLLEVMDHGESLGHFVSTVIKPNHDADRVQVPEPPGSAT